MPAPTWNRAELPREESAGRLFLAVDLPDEVRRDLDHHLRDALRGASLPGRPVPPANWHLTLRFLGETPAAWYQDFSAQMRETALGPPFAIRLGRWGAFPGPQRAAALWLGVAAGQEPLRALAARVEAAAVASGFPPETRLFSPHLTLSRLRPPRDTSGFLSAVPRFDAVFTIGEVALFRSHLGSGPPRYKAVARFPLG